LKNHFDGTTELKRAGTPWQERSCEIARYAPPPDVTQAPGKALVGMRVYLCAADCGDAPFCRLLRLLEQSGLCETCQRTGPIGVVQAQTWLSRSLRAMSASMALVDLNGDLHQASMR